MGIIQAPKFLKLGACYIIVKSKISVVVITNMKDIL